MDTQVILFLNRLGLLKKNEKIKNLNKKFIDREKLLNKDTYDKLKHYIPKFKNYLSSTFLTSLQSNAKEKQKWPLLNLLRQILKYYKFKLNPIRKSDGYDINGKKKFKRFFQIIKI